MCGRNRGRRVVEEPDAAGEGEDDDGPPELLEGDEYQAVLPQQRPRPKRPTAEEARWLQHRLLAPGAWGDPSRRVRILSSTDASGRRFKYALMPEIELTSFMILNLVASMAVISDGPRESIKFGAKHTSVGVRNRLISLCLIMLCQ